LKDLRFWIDSGSPFPVPEALFPGPPFNTGEIQLGHYVETEDIRRRISECAEWVRLFPKKSTAQHVLIEAMLPEVTAWMKSIPSLELGQINNKRVV